jgi:Protein of unknown function (DUF4239)
MFSGIGLIAFCAIFGAALVGFLLGRKLPQDSRSEATQRTVQNVMNVVGILSALVLGLLIASGKANFDTRNTEVEQFASILTLLDRELAHFDQEGKEPRALLRAFTERKLSLGWPKDRGTAPAMHDGQAAQALEDIEERVGSWSPQAEAQRERRTTALQLVGELKRTSRLLVVQETAHTPTPFLIVVIFWLSMLFLSHTTFAPFNRTVVAALLISALAVSIAVNLIFDMDQPLSGFVRVSPTPLRQALDLMTP